MIFAQHDGSLIINRRFVYSNGKKLDKKEIKAILMSNQQSTAEYAKSHTNASIGSVALIAGSGFALYLGSISLGSSLNDVKNLNEGNMETSDGSNLIFPAVATLGFISIGAFLMLSSNKHLRKSIDIYNSGLLSTNIDQLEFGVTESGVGVVLKF